VEIVKNTVVTVLGFTLLFMALNSQLFLTGGCLKVLADSEEFRISGVQTCDANDIAKFSFEKGTSMFVQISINYSGTGTKSVLLLASAYDPKNVPIGLTWSTIFVSTGTFVSTMSLLIPKSAETGKGTVLVTCYSDWPRNGGVPLCPEGSATFDIIPSAILGDVTGSTPNVPDGVVDMRDIAAICSKFGTTPSNPNWNPNMDLNKDGVVNMRDLMLALANLTM
jgi:hypothetical protein